MQGPFKFISIKNLRNAEIFLCCSFRTDGMHEIAFIIAVHGFGAHFACALAGFHETAAAAGEGNGGMIAGTVAVGIKAEHIALLNVGETIDLVAHGCLGGCGAGHGIAVFFHAVFHQGGAIEAGRLAIAVGPADEALGQRDYLINTGNRGRTAR